MRVAQYLAALAVIGLVMTAVPPAPLADDADDRVIVTRPGVVFHKIDGDDIRGTGVTKSIDAALESGYTPCRVCFGKELGSMRPGSQRSGAGGPGVVLGEASVSIPAPPSSTVMQPFGVKIGNPHKGRSKGLRNPYDTPETRNFTIEHGAFEQR